MEGDVGPAALCLPRGRSLPSAPKTAGKAPCASSFMIPGNRFSTAVNPRRCASVRRAAWDSGGRRGSEGLWVQAAEQEKTPSFCIRRSENRGKGTRGCLSGILIRVCGRVGGRVTAGWGGDHGHSARRPLGATLRSCTQPPGRTLTSQRQGNSGKSGPQDTGWLPRSPVRKSRQTSPRAPSRRRAVPTRELGFA